MQPDSYKIWLLLAFSMQGGIEKFNRALLHTFYLIQNQNRVIIKCSILLDGIIEDNPYIKPALIQSFGGRKIPFIISAIGDLFKKESWIIGHINLAIIGCLQKILMPSQKLIVICHGIEVFSLHSGIRKKLLKMADVTLMVSNHIKTEFMYVQRITEHKIQPFPLCN
jgi:hypothetical protein